MKKTKRAKKIKVTWSKVQYTSKISEFQCPCCRTVFRNTLDEKTIRFYCDCGQELAITSKSKRK